MKKAYVFPGQGAQFVGMGKDLYDQYPQAKAMFEEANEILGFRITDVMFSGTDEDLRQTKVTQPAVFLHSVISAFCENNGCEVRSSASPNGCEVRGASPTAECSTSSDTPHRERSEPEPRTASVASPQPDMVAGHSLGEFSALVVAGALSFADGLRLVYARALAMQKACELQPSTMAAILGLADDVVERICEEIDDVVVPANYNSPGQLVISGTIEGVEEACQRLKEAGAKRALPLKVGGAFHSPLMQPAAEELQKAIEQTEFKTPICPIYQNVDAKPHTDPTTIKQNLILQLTAPVRWTQIVENMLADATVETGHAPSLQSDIEFTEFGPGNVLTGLIAKIKK